MSGFHSSIGRAGNSKLLSVAGSIPVGSAMENKIYAWMIITSSERKKATAFFRKKFPKMNVLEALDLACGRAIFQLSSEKEIEYYSNLLALRGISFDLYR